MQIQGNQQSFNGSYRMYFFTNDGKRIVSDENMSKCLHYVEAQLNRSKRYKEHNMDLIDTFRSGQKDATGRRIGGDADYFYNPKIRAVLKRAKDRVEGFVRIVTGRDVDVVNEEYGSAIGRAKRISRERTGSTRGTFETANAVDRYYDNGIKYADRRNTSGRAFGVVFTPVFKKDGTVKRFEYSRSGYFKDPN